MVTIYVSNGRETRRADERRAASGCCRRAATSSGSISQSPTDDEARILAEPFGFHELAIEDALREIQTPKVESYSDHLYLILHGIDFYGRGAHASPRTRSTSSSASSSWSPSTTSSRGRSRTCSRSVRATTSCWPRGRQRCCTASSTRWSTTTGPRSTSSRRGSTRSRTASSTEPVAGRRPADPRPQARRGVAAPRGHAAARRRRPAGAARVLADLGGAVVPLPRRLRSPRPAGRRGRRCIHDRITSLLDAHLSFTSNRLNQVMKTLTIISTIFLPLTVLTGMFGMNVDAAGLSRRRGGAVLVDRRHDGRHRRHDALVLQPVQVPMTRSRHADPPAAAGGGQPDRRRRGDRAAGLGGQGAGRERPRRRRASHRDRHRAGRQGAGARRGRRRRHVAGRRRARAAAPRHLEDRHGARSRRHPHARLPRRGAAVDRVGVPLRAADAGARQPVRDGDPRRWRDGGAAA